eukprot:4410808-Karenia_brevis.AAC.1
MSELGESVWKGDLPAETRGIRVLGAPLGTPEYTASFGPEHVNKTRQLLTRMLDLAEGQHAWLLLYFCIVPRFNHLLREVLPSLLRPAAEAADDMLQFGLRSLLGMQDDSVLPEQALA